MKGEQFLEHCFRSFNQLYNDACIIKKDFLLKVCVGASNLYKTAYFIPFITPMIVIAIIWQWIFDPNIGLLNQLFNLNIKWLYDIKFAMPILIIVSVWKLIGYNIILFLSGKYPIELNP